VKCCLLALWAVLGTPVAAQQPTAMDDVSETRRFSVGLRAGAFEPLAFADAYDAIYGESLVPFGARFEFRPRRTPDVRPKWFLALTTDFASADGERVAFVPEPVPTGTPTSLDLNPWHFTSGWLFRPATRFHPYVGVGVTALRWEEADDFESLSGTDIGGHAVLGIRWRAFNLPLAIDGEALYYLVPGVFDEDAGAAAFFGEQDLGGLTAAVTLSWEF
jgi:hypothetical protein